MSFFTEQREKQADIVNVYIDVNEKKHKILMMAKKAEELAKRHLFFVGHPKLPTEVSDWHEQRAKLNLEIGARLIQYYNKL